ncbi:hypothetical protein [Streptomyces canus]|uniref:hypothetical protein n=1 Tax=Streptomyces canus TaxID=58343 RepID=UPI00278B9AC0|nr:hypothetical protein [Streptomyces canus]MDQ0764955.1 hypothetical protein [Streptomyces canus]
MVRRPPRRPSTLDPYLDYLQQRWDEGEHSAKILHQELLTKGYLGHYQRVKMAVAPLRRGLPLDRGGMHFLEMRYSVELSGPATSSRTGSPVTSTDSTAWTGRTVTAVHSGDRLYNSGTG